MPTYRVTFRVHPGVRRLLLDVEADEYEIQRHGGWHVFWCYALVVDRPRRVVVLRAPGVAVACVERRCARPPELGVGAARSGLEAHGA